MLETMAAIFRALACDARLVILDSLVDLLGEVDENSNVEMGKAAERLRAIAETVGGFKPVGFVNSLERPKPGAQHAGLPVFWAIWPIVSEASRWLPGP